jgi:hypothetical protein
MLIVLLNLLKMLINFNFKILIGLITNVISFIPVFVLIQLFKITSIRHSKSKRLGIILEKINKFMLKNKRPKILVKSNEKQFGKKSFLLPWWFKFVLYLISFSLMALSITFVILKGKRYMFFFIIYFIIS